MSIHSTAIIHPDSIIDESSVIGPFCIIGKGVNIGAKCKVHSNVVIKGPTSIDEGNTIYQFSSIGEDTPDKKFKGEDTKLIIGKNNIFREGVTIHRGTIQDNGTTQIGSDNLIMAYAHIAHDCVIGNNNTFANNSGLAGHVKVGNNVTLGGYTLIHQFCNIGDCSFTGMNTTITMDLPAYVKAASHPARVVGLNTVGLSRNGISEESISHLKKAYKLLYRKSLKLEEALLKIEELNNKYKDKHLLSFINSVKISSRGITR